MRLVRIIGHRFRSLFRCSKVEAELQRELGLHLDQLTREYIASGMSESEARLTARRAFGSIDLTKEQCRDMRRVNLIEDMTNDLAFAFRLLRKSPGFMLTAVLTLALGIGANSAMFSVVHSLLIEPLPYPQADRLVTLSARSAAGQNMALSYPDFLDFREQASAFESVAAYQDYGFTVTGAGEAQRLPGRTVSAEFFSTLGVVPTLGRDFNGEDNRPGSPPVVVLSNQAWQRLFQLDPDIIGRDVTLNGRSFTVVGILPQTFQFYLPGDVFAPIGLGLRPSLRGQRRGIYAICRLRPGATFLQAQSDVDTIARRLGQQYPENAGVGARLVLLVESFVGKTKPVVLTLLGAVSFVLLIACANVANLLLARAASRQREIVLRIALGASKSRLLRQMLTESVLLALAGGGCGLLLGLSSLRLINSLLPENISRLKHVDVNGWVLGFTLLLSVATGAIFGLAPAWEAIRGSLGSLHGALKACGRGAVSGGGRWSVRSVLVMSEVALSLMLLIGAGLMMRTLLSLQSVDPGFRIPNRLRTQVILPPAQYTPARQVTFFSQFLERVRSLPGVESASMVMCLPLTGGCWAAPVELDGRPPTADREQQEVNFNAVTPDYFRTMGIPIVHGRDFQQRDTTAAPAVAIVSEAFSRRYFADENALGRRVRQRSGDPNTPLATVVGVVADVRRYGLDAPLTAEVYLPLAQNPVNFMTLVVHASGNPLNLSAAVRGELNAADRNLPLAELGTMEGLQERGVATRQFPAILLGLFAAIALTLASVGIYGVIAYSVSQRTSEIGIRMALGAKRADVVWLVIDQGMTPVWIGLLIGVCVSLALARTLSSLLYGVTATDPLTFGAVALVLFGTGVLACALPARRAARIDPIVALRTD